MAPTNHKRDVAAFVATAKRLFATTRRFPPRLPSLVPGLSYRVKESSWLCWLVLLFLAGCATTDWNSRIGLLTYEQAVAELGTPIVSTNLSDGTRVADWLVRRGSSGSVGFGAGSAFATPGLARWHVPEEVQLSPSQYLRLTFRPDGTLKAWNAFYR